MRQVMRVQWFSMKKYTGYRLILIAGVLFTASLTYEVMRAEIEEGWHVYALLEIFRLSMFVQVFVMDLVLNLDDNNGLLKQDLMAGVNRDKLFFGKIVFSNAIAIVLELVFMLYVTILIGLCHGLIIEGVGSMLIRFMLLLFLHFRIAGEVTICSLIIKKTFITSALYVLMFYVGKSYEMELEDTWFSKVFVHSVLDKVAWYEYKTVYALEGGIVDVLQYFPNNEVLLVSSVGSVLIGCICIGVARFIFTKRE